MQDPEARELLEKIRRVNPHAEIASVVKLSTYSALSRSVGGAELARPSPRGCATLSHPASSLPAAETKPYGRTVEPASIGEGVQQEVGGREEGGGQQIGGRGVGRGASKRRTLMGRMLENGTSMLDRQKEWVKARSKKVHHRYPRKEKCTSEELLKTFERPQASWRATGSEGRQESYRLIYRAILLSWKTTYS